MATATLPAENVPLSPPTANNSDFVGEECAKLGITVSKLEAGLPININKEKITEAVIVEIDCYRIRSKSPLLATGRWMRLLLGERCGTKSDRSLTKRAEDMRMRCKGNAVVKFRNTVFSFANERVIDNSSLHDIQSTSIASLEKANMNLKKEKKTLQKKLTKSYNKLKVIETSKVQAQSQVRLKNKELKGIKKVIKKKQKTDKQREARLNKRAETLAVKEAALDVEFKPYNVKRRFETKTREISTLKADKEREIQQLKEEIKDIKFSKKTTKKLKSKIKTLKRTVQIKDTTISKKRRELKSLRLTIRKMKRTQSTDRPKCSAPRDTRKQLVEKLNIARNEVKNLKHDLNQAEEELASLHNENKPVLKDESGQYTDDVKLAYMTLASLGISAKKMSQVVEIVLSTICRYDITSSDLPKETYCRERFKDCNSAATIQVAEELSSTKYATLHSDGTSRDGNKVIGFQVTTDAGTRTLGLLDVHSGDADTQLEAFNFIMEKLGDVLSDGDTTTKSKELVSHIKNTMGDQAATQKSFNSKLEVYRQSILPDIQDNWDQLDVEVQRQLGCMNHFFCNLHTLIGAATYCDAAMKQLEETWRTKYGQLGVESLKTFQDKEGNYSWKHTDSAVQRLVRTASDTIAPGGDQKSGCISGFRSFRMIHNIKPAKVIPFRANRFNILFSNAAGIYYHRNHIKSMFLDGWVKAENKLLQAVLADIQCQQLLAGVRALGILHKQLTEPFWKLTERHDVHVLQLSQQVQTAFNLLDSWSRDASALLDKDMNPVFSVQDISIEPVKDDVFYELYSEHSDESQNLTKEALEAQCTHMKVLFERRHTEQLTGKYSGEMTDQLWDETRKTQKSNRIGENDLGYWAHIMDMAPSLGVMSAEGKMAYRRNHTRTYLTGLQKTNPAKFTKVMKRIRKTTRKWERRYTQRTMSNQNKKARIIEMAKATHDKQKRRRAQLEKARFKYITQTGGECRTSADVIALESKQVSKTRKLEVLRKHTTFLKNRYNLTRNVPQFLKNSLAFDRPEEKNSVDKLKENLQTIVTYINTNNLQPNHVNVDPMEDEDHDTEEQTTGEENESDGDDIDEDSDSDGTETHMGTAYGDEQVYAWKLADTVAIAYEDGWYLAVVASILSEDTATVNWLKLYPNGKWGWPTSTVEQVGDIERKFVFAWGLDLIPDASMRFLSLDETMTRDVKRRYYSYFNKYFVAQQ